MNDRHRRRRLSCRWDDDGMLVIPGRFSPEDGALILAALDTARPDVVAAADSDTDQPIRVGPTGEADSMVALARTALAHAAAVDTGPPAHVVNVHVALEDLLADGNPFTNPTVQTPCLEDGPELHLETVRRLCCDSAAVIVAHHRDGLPGTSIDVGRHTRVVSPRLRRALVLRDGGCAAPGCTATKFLHAHHVRHWIRGGPTTLANLILLCTFHHHLVHEGGYDVRADRRGGFTFHTPEGTRIEPTLAAAGGDPAAVPDLHDATITSWTATPRWYGERLDLHYAVSVLLHAEERAKARLADDSAESSAPPTGPDLN